MATAPAFAAAPGTEAVSFATANTNRDGTTGTYATVLTAGASGTRVESLSIAAAGTTTAGVIRLWVYNGTARFLIREILVSAITPSTTVAAWFTEIPFVNLILPTGFRLDISTHNAETFHAIAYAGDF